MGCLGCDGFVGGGLCPRCRASLQPAPERVVEGGLLVRPALVHEGAARALVHAFKYRGVVAAGRPLAEAMAPLVPEGVVLVPVPRVTVRLVRYGIDPALELANQLGRLVGTPTVTGLSAPLWGRRRAGRSHGFAPQFRARGRVLDRPVVLVDDVVTTGATIAVAARLVPGATSAVTATGSNLSVPRVTSLPQQGPTEPGLEVKGWK